MKKIFCFLLTAGMTFMSHAANAAGEDLRVQGKLQNFGDTAIVLVSALGAKDTETDTFLVKNGEFDFKVRAGQVSAMAIVTPKTMRRKEYKIIRLPAVPGETVELRGDVKTRYDITGSAFYKQYHEVDLMLENAEKEGAEFDAALQKRLKDGEDRDAIMKEYQEKAPELAKKMEQTMMDFIRQHPDNEACVTLINRFDTPERMDEAVGYLSASVRNGRMKPYYSYYINKVKEEKAERERGAERQTAGAEAPDFTLNDINGKPLSLSSLRGKYVVLDFWGSWCGWCIKGFPEMKKYYEKYKDKMEILGIDCNDREDKWKATVKEHGLPWLHVYNPKDSRVLEDYGIRGYPTKIIVGPDGKIVKTVLGEDPAFYTFLDELFGK